MANDSTVAGYLQPVGTSPPEDANLDSIFQQLVVGLTGLPGSMVRPRWQATVPKQPDPSTNWCAVGITGIEHDANAYEQHNPAGSGTDTVIRHEILTVLCSFYGPAALNYAAQTRDGMYVAQNNATLDPYEMGLVEVGSIVTAPELVNQQWIRRFDLNLRIRRRIVRTYQILTVLSAHATASSETQTEPISVHQ
ncbi:hypothetical protein G3N58_17615 [Paraburkholderia sp. Ac-20342]|uniref:phage neck terminator protein n=1 Tax=Paraburkholderia sp. Ac-20342 TaxID=2703889 RepID=UPI00197F5886|nr:hypothetical protein [Paraburkholderia sp. Ac-20342]MBN3848626.1 hypothetical protein [Paraburkholderia sp. Ac-20342]